MRWALALLAAVAAGCASQRQLTGVVHATRDGESVAAKNATVVVVSAEAAGRALAKLHEGRAARNAAMARCDSEEAGAQGEWRNLSYSGAALVESLQQAQTASNHTAARSAEGELEKLESARARIAARLRSIEANRKQAGTDAAMALERALANGAAGVLAHGQSDADGRFQLRFAHRRGPFHVAAWANSPDGLLVWWLDGTNDCVALNADNALR